MKLYGVLDAPGTDRLREILEDVSETSRRKDCTLYVGEDAAGRIISTTSVADGEMFRDSCHSDSPCECRGNPCLEACGVNGNSFFDHAAYVRYTIDEILPRVHDVFAHGVVRYGGLRPMSEGRLQLADALNDARRQMAKYDKLFILGMNRDREIMIAPLDRESEFVSPLACVIGKNGAWRLSDICSDRCPYVEYNHGYSASYSAWNNDMRRDLYVGMGYREKNYGKFNADGTCMAKLERAFEDAAKLAAFYKEPFEVLLYEGTIYTRFTEGFSHRTTGSDGPPVRVIPGEFLAGGVLSLDKIEAAARKAYDIFLPRYEEFAAKDASGT